MRKKEETILVTGATGNVGRQVVAQLHQAGARVRALTRNSQSDGFPADVDVVGGDLSKPDTLERSMQGVDAVLLVWPFFTAEGAARAVHVLSRYARRIVYVSALPLRDHARTEIEPVTVWADVEHVIENSGADWTFLRCSGFAANTARFWATQIHANDVVRWPYGAAARSLIHERDIAAVAVRALMDRGHARTTYFLTGPESLTHIEQVRTIGEAIGRPLMYDEISPDTARRQMLAEGWPSAMVDSALYYWSKLVGEPEAVTTTVEDVTRAPAHTFREWANDHAADFRRG